MAQLLITIEKEDIVTKKLGDNILVQLKNDIGLVFSPNALEELLNDYKIITAVPEPLKGDVTPE